MTLDLRNEINELQNSKGISGDLILDTIESALTKAYLKRYGTIENLVIKREEAIISIFSRMEVVEEVEDDLREISIEELKKDYPNAEIGDQFDFPCNPEDFGRIAIHSAKQIIIQKLREIQKNTLLSEYKSKEGQLIIGYIQRIRDDGIYVDIGNFEGFLPKSNQSPHEFYETGDRIKTYVQSVKNNKRGNISVILTRTAPEFVTRLLEVEIPEVYDKTVEIKNIVREPGYRTKVAVFSDRDDVDPVGSCVGQKGSRIQNIIKELEGEKIDVLKWSIDIRKYIENALTPAAVDQVVIIDENNKRAIAIVDDSQLSFAIGKKGLNIKLANRLTNWNIEIKTREQAIEMDILEDHQKLAEELFSSDKSNEIDDLELPAEIKIALVNNSIFKIQQLIDCDDFLELDGFDEEMKNIVETFIDQHYEIVEDDDEVEEVIEEGQIHDDGIMYYDCPECGAQIPETADKCPGCGIEIAFEEEDEE